MLEKRDSIDRLRVAAPCPMSWEGMKGDERVRLCEQCDLHIYNISEMTRKEALALISGTEERICARLYKRADGTVLTKDCPVGLRALRRRVSRVAGAAVTAILSLCMSALGKNTHHGLHNVGAQLRITRSNFGMRVQPNRAEISGRVLDLNGEVVEGAAVTILNQETGKKSKAKTNSKGIFQFSMLQPGLYTIEIEYAGFQTFWSSNMQLGASETIHEDFRLEVAGATVGIVVTEEIHSKPTGTGTTTVFSGDKARRLPF